MSIIFPPYTFSVAEHGALANSARGITRALAVSNKQAVVSELWALFANNPNLVKVTVVDDGTSDAIPSDAEFEMRDGRIFYSYEEGVSLTGLENFVKTLNYFLEDEDTRSCYNGEYRRSNLVEDINNALTNGCLDKEGVSGLIKALEAKFGQAVEA